MATMPADLTPFDFGPLHVRPATREIIGPGGTDVLEPRVMDVLLVLVAAAGDVVTRDALVSACWDGRAVSDDAINRVIQRLRKLGTGVAAGAFAIKTVHKLGYRLILTGADAPVAAPPPVPAATPPPAPASPRHISRRGWLIGAGGAAMVAGFAGWRWRGDGPAGSEADALLAEARQVLRGGMPDTDARAAALLERAVRIDPGHGAAWGALALARAYQAEFAPPERTGALVLGVQEAAARAIRIDPRAADGHAALAILPPYFGDWHAAERRMRRVLAIAPGHLPTRDGLDFLLTAVGRIREGCGDRVRMAALDPLHATYQFKLIFAHWLLGDLAEADRAADRALALWPRHPGIFMARFYTYALTGRAERALDHLATGSLQPGLPPPLMAALRLAATALATRRPADKAAARAALVDSAIRTPHAAVNAITLLGGLDEIDAAFGVAQAYLLERGPLMARVRWGEAGLPLRDQRRRGTIMLFIPATAGLRADPRFEPLVADVGLAAYWRRAGVGPDYRAARG